jgi:hypothetical protein
MKIDRKNKQKENGLPLIPSGGLEPPRPRARPSPYSSYPIEVIAMIDKGYNFVQFDTDPEFLATKKFS